MAFWQVSLDLDVTQHQGDSIGVLEERKKGKMIYFQHIHLLREANAWQNNLLLKFTASPLLPVGGALKHNSGVPPLDTAKPHWDD